MSTTTSRKPAAKRSNKREQVLALMRRPNGATMADLIKASGWQPHSTRAVISGLRKEGHAIRRAKRDNGESCYVLADQG